MSASKLRDKDNPVRISSKFSKSKKLEKM